MQIITGECFIHADGTSILLVRQCIKIVTVYCIEYCLNIC